MKYENSDMTDSLPDDSTVSRRSFYKISWVFREIGKNMNVSSE